VPNLNAAAGTLWLNVDPTHWLYVASGGTLPPTPGAAGRFRVSWTALWIEWLKFSPLDAALHATLVARSIGNLRLLHDGFQRAVAGGLDFSVRGSPEGALAAFSEFCMVQVQTNPIAWTVHAANIQALPAVPAGAPALPAGSEWFLHLEFGMGRKATGSLLPLSAILAVLPGWPSHLGRGAMPFQDASGELFDIAGSNRAIPWPAVPRITTEPSTTRPADWLRSSSTPSGACTSPHCTPPSRARLTWSTLLDLQRPRPLWRPSALPLISKWWWWLSSSLPVVPPTHSASPDELRSTHHDHAGLKLELLKVSRAATPYAFAYAHAEAWLPVVSSLPPTRRAPSVLLGTHSASFAQARSSFTVWLAGRPELVPRIDLAPVGFSRGHGQDRCVVVPVARVHDGTMVALVLQDNDATTPTHQLPACHRKKGTGRQHPSPAGGTRHRHQAHPDEPLRWRSWQGRLRAREGHRDAHGQRSRLLARCMAT
jgi:hypothetical protein